MSLYPIAKRGLDMVCASVALLVLSPLLVPIAIALRLTGEGEVFYRQERIGFKNRRFGILKFATMLKNSPNIGPGPITLRDDPRVLPLGKFLRQTKINELPQILNILLGDMSLVGPRPLVEKTFQAYPPEIRERVYDVPPGLTGVGSIVFRDEERLVSSHADDPHGFYEREVAPYKGALEMWYQQHRGFGLDVVLIALTAWYVLAPESRALHRIFPDLPRRG